MFLNLEQFPNYILSLVTLTFLESAGQISCRMHLNGNMSGCFRMVRVYLNMFGENTTWVISSISSMESSLSCMGTGLEGAQWVDCGSYLGERCGGIS